MAIKKTKFRIIPNTTDGNFEIKIPLKTDQVYYDNNTIVGKLSNSTDPNLSKTISINEDENTILDYSVETSSLSVTEGSSGINVSVDIENLVGNPPTRQITLSTNGSDDVTIPSELSLTGNSQSFEILANNDSLLEEDENYSVTLTDTNGKFNVDSAGYLEDQGVINITVQDNDVASYSLSSDFDSVDENGGQVVFSIASNVRKTVDPIPFTISESAGVDNIASVTGTDVFWNNDGEGTFIPSSSDGSSTITVTLQSDSLFKEGNSFDFAASSVGLSKSININEGDTINYDVTASPLTISEGSPAITVDISTSNVLNFSSDRTLSIVPDSEDQVTLSSTTVTIPAGQTSGSFTITPVEDNFDEDNQNITIEITDLESSNFDVNGVSSGTTGSCSVSINLLDNDVASYSLSSDFDSVNENGGIVAFSIASNIRKVIDPIPFTISETVSVNNINSVEGTDVTWDPASKTGTFIPSSSDGSSTINVTLKLDSLFKEGNSFDFAASSVGLSKSININEGDTINYDVTASPLTISEGSPAITVDISTSNVLNFSSDRTLSIVCDSDQVTLSSNSVIIPAGQTSGSFTITPVEDNFDEDNQNITIEITDLESSNFTVNSTIGNSFQINLSDNDEASYSLSSDVDSVNENGGEVKFTVSSNIRKVVDPITFEIVESVSGSLSADNIENVYQRNFHLDDNFDTDLSGWYLSASSSGWHTNITHYTLHGGSMRLGSRYHHSVYAETPISHPNSGTQINTIRVDIPEIYDNNSKLYIQIFEDDQLIQNSGWIDLDGTEIAYDSITANGDGTYSGYVEIDFTYDVDLNSEYKLRIGHQQIYGTPYHSYIYLGNVSISENKPSWNPASKTGTFIPSPSDGSSVMIVKLKSDDIFWDGNSFVFQSVACGISKTIDINEDQNTPLDYSISYTATAYTEGDVINVGVGILNIVGSTVPTPNRSLTISATTHSNQITYSTTSLPISSINESFSITVNDDEYIEIFGVTQQTKIQSQNSNSTFLVNNGNTASGGQSTGSCTLHLSLTDNDGSSQPIYKIYAPSSGQSINEGESITYTIDGNVKDGRSSVTYDLPEVNVAVQGSPVYSSNIDQVQSASGHYVSWDSNTNSGYYTSPMGIDDGPVQINISTKRDSTYKVHKSFEMTFSESGSFFEYYWPSGNLRSTSQDSMTINFEVSETMSLSSDKTSVEEGETLIFSISGAPINSSVPYIISGSGITAADLGLSSLSGNFSIDSNGDDQLVIAPIIDYVITGDRNLTLTIPGYIDPEDPRRAFGDYLSHQVTVTDEKTPVLTTSSQTIYEGESVTYTVTNIAPYETVDYTITGTASLEDLGLTNSSGSITANSLGVAEFQINTVLDLVGDTDETIVFTLDSSNVSSTVTINPQFVVVLSDDNPSEGQTITIQVYGMPYWSHGNIYYTIYDVNGNRVGAESNYLAWIKQEGNHSSFTRSFTIPTNSRIGDETIKFHVGENYGIGNLPVIRYNLKTISIQDVISPTVTSNVDSITEGLPVTFSFVGLAPNQYTNYTISTESGSGITTSDFSGLSSLSGSILADSDGKSQLTLTTSLDIYSETDHFKLSLPDYADAPNSSKTVEIVDKITYAVNTTTIKRGWTATFTIQNSPSDWYSSNYHEASSHGTIDVLWKFKYYRIKFTGQASSNIHTITAKGRNNSTIGISGVSASSSGNASGNYNNVAHIIDGNNSTRVTVGHGEYNSWIDLDLYSEQKVYEFYIKGSGVIKDYGFTIQATNNKSSGWITLQQVSSSKTSSMNSGDYYTTISNAYGSPYNDAANYFNLNSTDINYTGEYDNRTLWTRDGDQPRDLQVKIINDPAYDDGSNQTLQFMGHTVTIIP